MMRPILGSLLTSSVVACAFVGCNSILDNQAGSLLVTDESGALPAPNATSAPDASAAPSEQSSSDAGSTTSPDASGGPSPTCVTGQQLCFGACVSLTDPLYGCGDPSCAPCSAGHSTMRCQGRECIVTGCDPGYADCNQTSTDGCETDLSQPASCGACNTVCGVDTPYCTPSGSTFHCTNGCTPAAPLKCGAQCVDPNTSTSQCGGCNIACPVVANGTEACTAGVCGFTCKPLFHACAGACIAQTDPAACGPACTACPVPAGGVATCVADVCGVACTAPNHLCGAKCVGDNDATACGAACTVCPVPPGGSATCTAGVCGSACLAGSHLCGGKCVADNDAMACGAACTVCPARANASATCAAGVCGFACSAGFGDCDANAANGCETNLTSSATHCGTCGIACMVPLTCLAGLCQ